MALHSLVRCQYEPFLRTLSGIKVKSCLEKKDKKTTFYEVELDETILFPEGGGQPFDTGSLNDVPVSAVYHTPDGRVAHRTTAPLTVGQEVSISVDWARRFDHMQQHSGQHLLSALAWRRFGWATHSWWLAAAPEPCHIEFDTGKITDEELALLEADANEAIREARAMKIHLFDSNAAYDSALEATGLNIRRKAAAAAAASDAKESKSDEQKGGHHDDEESSAEPTVGAPIRVMEIDGVDFNKCCGTHLTCSSQLQMVKLLSTQKSRTNTRIFFLAGNRAIQAFDNCVKVERSLNTLLNVGSDKYFEFVKKLQADSKDLSKLLAARTEEMCELLAEKLLTTFQPKQPVFVYREDANVPFLSLLADALQGRANALNIPADSFAMLLTGGAEFVLRGPEALITAQGQNVAKALGAKAGGKKGAMQGKAPVSFSVAQRDEALKVLADAFNA